MVSREWGHARRQIARRLDNMADERKLFGDGDNRREARQRFTWHRQQLAIWRAIANRIARTEGIGL